MPTRRRNPPVPADDSGLVIVHLGGDAGPPLTWRPERTALQAAAMRWASVARNRERWRTAGKDPAQSDDGPLAGQWSDAECERLARAELVEVSLPGDGPEHEDWAFRVFPWEYALTALTRRLRTGPMVVWRHLRRRHAPADAAIAVDHTAIVECAPGRLAQFYDTQGRGRPHAVQPGLRPGAGDRTGCATPRWASCTQLAGAATQPTACCTWPGSTTTRPCRCWGWSRTTPRAR
jgi:hypothetical protein